MSHSKKLCSGVACASAAGLAIASLMSPISTSVANAQWQGVATGARYGIQRGAQWCATNVGCSAGAAGLSRPSWGEINGAAEAYRRNQWNNPNNAPGKGRTTIGGYNQPRGTWYNPRSW